MTDPLRWLLAPNPSAMTLDGTRTYLVGRREVAVIDPGPDLPEHVDKLTKLLRGAASVEVILTHHHADHAGAARELAVRTGAKVWGGGANGSGGAARQLREGAVIRTDAGDLKVLELPGHTPDHLALLWLPAGNDRGGVARVATQDPGSIREGEERAAAGIFVGDLLLGEGDTALVAAPEGSVADYLRSLDRLQELRPAVLYPAHGPPLRDPEEAIARFRRHRLQRVEEVRMRLADAPDLSTGELVEHIYGELDPRVRLAAAGSVDAIRSYLAGH